MLSRSVIDMNMFTSYTVLTLRNNFIDLFNSYSVYSASREDPFPSAELVSQVHVTGKSLIWEYGVG